MYKYLFVMYLSLDVISSSSYSDFSNISERVLKKLIDLLVKNRGAFGLVSFETLLTLYKSSTSVPTLAFNFSFIDLIA